MTTADLLDLNMLGLSGYDVLEILHSDPEQRIRRKNICVRGLC